MEIIGAEKLDEFAQRHPNARSALNRWYRLIDEGTFRSIVELRETFPHADPVPTRSGKLSQAEGRTTLTVFNIGGNKRVLLRLFGIESKLSLSDRWKRMPNTAKGT